MTVQTTLNLLFPQWQGSGVTCENYHGAMLLYDYLKERANFAVVPISLDRSLDLENNILGYSPILQQLTEAKNIIQQDDPERLFVVGGDCSIDLAPICFLNQKYDRNLAVIWIDAHADLNTPASSPSKHFHGMPLRVLLGEGDSEIIRASGSILLPKQIFLVGARNFDPPEKSHLEQQNISLFSSKTIEHNSQSLFEAIAQSNCQNLHIHCDLDAIDPLEFPFVRCPAANGLSIKLLKQLLQQLQNRFNLVGFSVTEFAPVKEQGLENIAVLVQQMFAQLQH